MSQDCSPGSPDGSIRRTPSGSAGESRTNSAWLYDAGGWYSPLESEDAPIAGTFTLHERGLSSPPLPYDAPTDVVNAARIELHERANRLDAEEPYISQRCLAGDHTPCYLSYRNAPSVTCQCQCHSELSDLGHPFSGQLSPEQEAALEEMMRRLNTQAFDNPTEIEPPEDETKHG